MIKQGDIFLVDFGTNSVGHEYQKRRPALVVESTDQLSETSLITVVPITSKIEKKVTGDIFVTKDEINLLEEDSLVKVSFIMSFDKKRFSHKIGEVSGTVMGQVKNSLRKHFGV